MTPTLLGGELGGVECIGTEVELNVVTVVVSIHYTTEVREARRHVDDVTDALSGGACRVYIVKILELAACTLEDFGTLGTCS